MCISEHVYLSLRVAPDLVLFLFLVQILTSRPMNITVPLHLRPPVLRNTCLRRRCTTTCAATHKTLPRNSLYSDNKYPLTLYSENKRALAMGRPRAFSFSFSFFLGLN
ncbi:hypothetical protein C8R45DRAFT_973047 [Mycena sanguinolenta]|nr:hypothetical protein C8R45DRAFT_973047 [Mycena sanguinolenta]